MKTKTITLTVLVGAALLVSARADIVSGLVGYWSLSEGPGASTVADASGNNNSGTLLNFADTTYANMWTGSTDPTNQWPSALLFNPSGEGTNTYVSIPDSPAIDSMSANRAWTLAAWVNCSVDGLSQTNGACIVSKGNQSREAFALYVNAGKFTTTFRNSAGTGSETVFSATVPAAGTWYHVVATVLEPKGSADAEAMVYVNGVRDSGPDANTYTTVYSTSLPVTIGCRPDSSGTLSNPFQGTIDDVRLYNRCLSASDIAELYQHKSTLAPAITTQPAPQTVYSGGSAGFTVSTTGLPPMSYQWRKNGMNLSDGGDIAGSLTSALKVRPVSSGDAGNYDVIITNRAGSATSIVAALTLATPTGEAYETAVRASNPVAYWQLNETGDPATNNSPVFDYMGGLNGIYDVSVQNGNPAYNIAGPQTGDGMPGFGSANTAAQFGHWAGSDIKLAPLNLSTNTVTITAWIKPNSPQAALNTILFCRGGDTVSGLRYGNFADGSGNYTLGYAWNNETPVANWNSQLTPPLNQWSFVALVVTPTNATMYLFNTNGLLSANNVYNHTNQSFGAATTLGWETGGSSSGGRAYSGTMDEVAVFNRSLSQQEVVNLYSAASGVANFAPSIGVPPASQTLYVGQTAQLLVTAGGTSPLYYRWQAGPVGSGVFTNVVNGGNVSGATTATLAFTNVAFANAADYLVVVANLFGAATSSVATVTVQPTGPPGNITMSTTQPAAGNPDWNTGSYWSDGNPASVSAVSNPGSTYEILPGGLMRSPASTLNAIFPGYVLTVDGDGVLENNTVGPGSTIGEIRFKQGSPLGTVYFPKLVMNGGQLDITGGTKLIIAGGMDILANTPIYNDTANNYACQIDARLAGTGSIEYHAYNQAAFVPGAVYGLNITGTSNTFSGKWNVVMGVLLGSAPGCLGTNNIVVGANGALETTYDINNPQASLVLSGRMFLHQNDTFKNVYVGAVPLNPGTYSFAQLNSNYPASFPATWTQQDGSSTAAGSGSITVLAASPPVIVTQPASRSWYVGQTVQFTVTAAGWQPLAYQWRIGGNGVFANLNDGGQFAGSTTPVLTISNIAPANGADYDVVITNSLGSVTSSVATLTVLPTGPAVNVTMSVMEPQNSDWDAGTYWSDGNPASVSAISNPGSTYEVLPGARLRSPAGATSAVFPGDVLTLDGDGVWVNNPPAGNTTIGEIRFKGAGTVSSVYFKRLVMNGGQLDQAAGSMVAIEGGMDILANTPLYNDSSSDHGFLIDAWLTGSGTIEFHAYSQNGFQPGYVYNLNIAGTSNTFSGQWNVVVGVLLGSAPGSLGTNNITVGANGALETSYDIWNPLGSLVLDGQMFLHQNDLFKSVTVSNVVLVPGTYTFANLSTAYPSYFPAAWTQQAGSAFSTGSGSITVLGNAPPPVSLRVQPSGPNLQLIWPQGTLLEATNLSGPWATNTHGSPFTITPTEPQKFYRVRVQ